MLVMAMVVSRIMDRISIIMVGVLVATVLVLVDDYNYDKRLWSL